MPKQPAKTTTRQSAKYREQQLRRRQTRAGEMLDYPVEEEVASSLPANGSTQVTYAPASAAVTPTRPLRPVAAPRPVTMPRRPTPAVATSSAVRTARGRVTSQVQAVNLGEEMQVVRDDIRRLLILAAVALVVLIALAVLLH